ncbi:hypothetical protein LCGC14_0320530 [marine sediment metagenome]|uniref:Uncharacterized protein n=1 Tax=marine sediment metagenome TaxID=412755 RepID=A0A0F9TJQ5_9ZZZZ
MTIKGIELPVRVVNGRFKLLSSDEYVDQLIRVALGNTDSENPFNPDGLGEFMIFALNDEQIEGEIEERVRTVFRILERDQIARLGRESPIRFEEDVVKPGEKIMFIDYVNLETGGRREVDLPLSGAS